MLSFPCNVVCNVAVMEFSPVAQPGNLAMFGNNNFFAFLNSSWGMDDILPGWELTSALFLFLFKI